MKEKNTLLLSCRNDGNFVVVSTVQYSIYSFPIQTKIHTYRGFRDNHTPCLMTLLSIIADGFCGKVLTDDKKLLRYLQKKKNISAMNNEIINKISAKGVLNIGYSSRAELSSYFCEEYMIRGENRLINHPTVIII